MADRRRGRDVWRSSPAHLTLHDGAVVGQTRPVFLVASSATRRSRSAPSPVGRVHAAPGAAWRHAHLAWWPDWQSTPNWNSEQGRKGVDVHSCVGQPNPQKRFARRDNIIKNDLSFLFRVQGPEFAQLGRDR